MKRNNERKPWTFEEKLCLTYSILFISAIVFYCVYDVYIRKEIDEDFIKVFEVVHNVKQNGLEYTHIYSYGKGSFSFRGNHDFQLDKTYFVKYQVHMKRWRDLTLIEWFEYV